MTAYKWKELTEKERIGYITAFVLIGSGIILAFLCALLNSFNITTGVLIYVAQCFVIGGSLVGVNIYLKTKWIEIDNTISDRIKEYIDGKTKQ